MLGEASAQGSTLRWAESHLPHIWISIFRVDAPIRLHVAEGSGHIAASTAIILRHTIHKVLRTQI